MEAEILSVLPKIFSFRKLLSFLESYSATYFNFNFTSLYFGNDQTSKFTYLKLAKDDTGTAEQETVFLCKMYVLYLVQLQFLYFIDETLYFLRENITL